MFTAFVHWNVCVCFIFLVHADKISNRAQCLSFSFVLVSLFHISFFKQANPNRMFLRFFYQQINSSHCTFVYTHAQIIKPYSEGWISRIECNTIERKYLYEIQWSMRLASMISLILAWPLFNDRLDFCNSGISCATSNFLWIFVQFILFVAKYHCCEANGLNSIYVFDCLTGRHFYVTTEMGLLVGIHGLNGIGWMSKMKWATTKIDLRIREGERGK